MTDGTTVSAGKTVGASGAKASRRGGRGMNGGCVGDARRAGGERGARNESLQVGQMIVSEARAVCPFRAKRQSSNSGKRAYTPHPLRRDV